jgi:hypothetical protein
MLVLAVGLVLPHPSVAHMVLATGGVVANGKTEQPIADTGIVTAQRAAPSNETSNPAQSAAAVPSYIEADRSPAEQTLGPALTGEVFSDRFTPLRKQLIAASVRANPASGCEWPLVFTLEIVAPVQATADASAWQERYLIKCKPDVRRTFLFVSTKTGVKNAELAPGGTITDMTLQQDVLQGVMAATIGRVPARCKDVRVRDTRVTTATDGSKPWTEVWTLAACGKPIDVEVHFTPSPRGGTDWSIEAGR